MKCPLSHSRRAIWRFRNEGLNGCSVAAGRCSAQQAHISEIAQINLWRLFGELNAVGSWAGTRFLTVGRVLGWRRFDGVRTDLESSFGSGPWLVNGMSAAHGLCSLGTELPIVLQKRYNRGAWGCCNQVIQLWFGSSQCRSGRTANALYGTSQFEIKICYSIAWGNAKSGDDRRRRRLKIRQSKL